MLIAWIAAIAAETSQPATRAAALRCTAATLRSSKISLDEVRGLTISIGEPDTLKLTYIGQFGPPCAFVIRKSLMGAIQLADGRALEEESDGESYAARDARPFGDDYDKSTAAERLLPKVAGMDLLSSDRVNSRSVGGDFVGVWRVGGKWLVQSFSQLEDRSFTAPRPILTSSLPVRSVMYFPGPDTPSSRLEVVQEQPNGTVRSLAFNWWHGSAFKHR